MNNLFVMHTQYNLILSCGVIKKHFNDSYNVLILYAEFNLGSQLKEKLEECFDKVYYVQDKYTYSANTFKEDLKLIKYMYKTKNLLNKTYDNVFISQENIYETYLLSKLSKKCNFGCYAIEEDVYYSVNNAFNIDPPCKGQTSFLGKCRKCFLDILLGKNICKQFVYFYGQNTMYDANYVLFPHQVRKELSGRTLIEIEKDVIIAGTESLYGNQYDIIIDDSKIVLFFFDLVERYTNSEKINKFVEMVSNICQANDVVLAYKYHPRETNKFDFPQNRYFVEIPSIIPAEKILYDLREKELTVMGNLTTSLWVAAKYGFNTYSFALLENSENIAAVNALQGMGIKMINNLEEVDFL